MGRSGIAVAKRHTTLHGLPSWKWQVIEAGWWQAAQDREKSGRLYLAQHLVLAKLVMPPWITNKGKEPLSIQTRRRSKRGQTKKAGVL